MANHPNRNAPVLIVYTEDSGGLLSRHSIRGMTMAEHIERYNIGPWSRSERLVGWPERRVEWHGRIGYAAIDPVAG